MDTEEESIDYILKFTAQTYIDSREPDVHILKYKATVCETSPITGEVIKSIRHYDVWRFNIDAHELLYELYYRHTIKVGYN